jgi:hypothetical protein
MRINDWVSILVFLGGLAWFVRHRNSQPSVAQEPLPDDKSGEPPDGADPADRVEGDGLGEPEENPALRADLSSKDDR